MNPASGGNHYLTGDLLDLHNYPAPELYLYDHNRPTVLGEYGGIGLVLNVVKNRSITSMPGLAPQTRIRGKYTK